MKLYQKLKRLCNRELDWHLYVCIPGVSWVCYVQSRTCHKGPRLSVTAPEDSESGPAGTGLNVGLIAGIIVAVAVIMTTIIVAVVIILIKR